MSTLFTVQRAVVSDAAEIGVMVGELLTEIMDAAGARAFNFDLAETISRLAGFLDREQYFVFVARSDTGRPAGFISLCESYALYAEGAFGTIPELYVSPQYRSSELGLRLVAQAKAFALSRGWSSLEVTTPPLPEFDRTLKFYQREGFVITGGRKMKFRL